MCLFANHLHLYVRRKPTESIDPRKGYHGGRMRTQNNLDACLSENERILAVSNLSSDANEVLDNTRSMKGLLEHLENLHHPSPVPLVEGLNVELLAFQRQSVQWALERETTPGGIQSFLWPKLPSVAEPGEELYYSPILERFRRDKPHLVRGGIIAEEMGLGKTVISLALVSVFIFGSSELRGSCLILFFSIYTHADPAESSACCASIG
jgi:SNF2 family DNA or RNA helicase